MKKPKETDILNQCLTYLRVVRKLKAWRQNSGGAKMGSRFVRFGEKGASDALAILPGGRLMCLETKRPGNKPTELQEAWLDEAREAGALVVVAHSLDELRAALAEAGYPE